MGKILIHTYQLIFNFETSERQLNECAWRVFHNFFLLFLAKLPDPFIWNATAHGAFSSFGEPIPFWNLLTKSWVTSWLLLLPSSLSSNEMIRFMTNNSNGVNGNTRLNFSTNSKYETSEHRTKNYDFSRRFNIPCGSTLMFGRVIVCADEFLVGNFLCAI